MSDEIIQNLDGNLEVRLDVKYNAETARKNWEKLPLEHAKAFNKVMQSSKPMLDIMAESLKSMEAMPKKWYESYESASNAYITLMQEPSINNLVDMNEKILFAQSLIVTPLES